MIRLLIVGVYRQGGVGLFQFTLHKNLNAYHRIEGVPSHASIHVKHDRELSYVPLFIHGFAELDVPSALAMTGLLSRCLALKARWEVGSLTIGRF
jgi:hypothetical protein